MKNIIHVKSISEVHEALGMPTPSHPLVTVLPVDERLTHYDYGDNHYVLDLYQISLKEGIKGCLSYGRNSYDFGEGTMTFFKPGQVTRIDDTEDHKNGVGWMLLFHPDLIRKSSLGKTIEQYNFFNYEVNEALHLSEKEKISITALVDKIVKEYNQNIDKHSQEIIIANIELMLKYCQRYYDRQFYTRTNLNKDIITQFEQVIREYYLTDKASDQGVLSVKYCADKLAMSSNYMGDLVKSETGRSAKDHIQDYIIEKAKNRIIGTNESIGEVAYSLGFEYPQSFNKLFKARTGMSPSAYRKLN